MVYINKLGFKWERTKLLFPLSHNDSMVRWVKTRLSFPICQLKEICKVYLIERRVRNVHLIERKDARFI